MLKFNGAKWTSCRTVASRAHLQQGNIAQSIVCSNSCERLVILSAPSSDFSIRYDKVINLNVKQFITNLEIMKQDGLVF